MSNYNEKAGRGNTGYATGYAQSEGNIDTDISINRSICQYAMTDAASQTVTETVPTKPFEISLLKVCIKYPVVPGSVCFEWSGHRYVDKMGSIFRDPDPATGVGVLVGTIDYQTGVISLDVYDGGENRITVHSCALRLGNQYVTDCCFYTPAAPIRPMGFTLAGTTLHGERFSVTAGQDGTLSDGKYIEGTINYDTGLVNIGFGKWIANDLQYENEVWYNPYMVDEENNRVWKPESVIADSLTYACVVYSYIPLSAALLGINTVRLPSDGRVAVVKQGDIVVIHNTAASQIDDLSITGQIFTFTLPRAADNVEIYDSSDPPLRVPKTLYAHEQGSDVITIDTSNDFSAYTLPLVAMHRIEDRVMVAGTQINGQITLTRGVTNSYPVEGTLVSSALLFGDLQARAFGLFDQKTWTNKFDDNLIGDPAQATYNEIDYPVQVKNSGAVTDRWALVFDSPEHFRIFAEQRGIIGEGYISNDVQPINQITNKPYFFMDCRGFGTGWAAGNVIRFNTEGATAAIWAVRTTLQGPESLPYDDYAIHPIGDAR